MPNLVATPPPPLTPEEEYLLSLEALAAEPIPPPADGYNGGGTYNPYADPANPQYVPPPPVEAAPAQNSVPEPVVYEQPASTEPYPASGYTNEQGTYLPYDTYGQAAIGADLGPTHGSFRPSPAPNPTPLPIHGPSLTSRPAIPAGAPRNVEEAGTHLVQGGNISLYPSNQRVGFGGYSQTPHYVDDWQPQLATGVDMDRTGDRGFNDVYNDVIPLPAEGGGFFDPATLPEPPGQPAFRPFDEGLSLAAKMDRLTLDRSRNQSTQPQIFRGVEQAPYTPPAVLDSWQYEPGMYQNRAPASEASLPDVFNIPTDTEGVSWDAVLDPSSWLPEPQRVYDAQGNEIVGYGEGAFIAGPPIVDSMFRAKGLRTSPASAGTAIRPQTRPPAATTSVAAQEVPPPAVAAQEVPGAQTFPRLAGKPGTPAGGGGTWGPHGEVVYPRSSAIPERAPIELPAETIPPPPSAPKRTPVGGNQKTLTPDEVQQVRAAAQSTQAFQRAAAAAAQPPRTLLSGAGVGGRSAARGRTVPTRQSGPGTGGAGIPADAPASKTIPPPETAAAPVGAANGRTGRLSAKRLAAILGAGAVGGGIYAANRSGGGEAPATVPDKPGASRAPLEPGIYSPSTNPQTPEDWESTTTESLEQMLKYDDSRAGWYSQTERRPITIDGTRQKTYAVKGMGTDKTPNIVGYLTPDDRIVPIGPEVSAEDAAAEIAANAAEAEPGWEGGVAAPGEVESPAGTSTLTGTGTSTGTTLEDVSVPAPAGTGGGSSRSSGGRSSRSSGGGSYDRGYGGGGGDNFSRGYERELTADDFMEAAGGNRRKAEFMAKAANRRRRGKSRGFGGGMFWPGFPLSPRPPSPVRANVLASLNEAFAEAFPNRQGGSS